MCESTYKTIQYRLDVVYAFLEHREIRVEGRKYRHGNPLLKYMSKMRYNSYHSIR